MSKQDVSRQYASISNVRNTYLRDRLLYSLLYELGLTVSEVVDLKISQWRTQRLHLGTRTLFLSTHTEQLFEEYVSTHKPQTFVFFSRQSPQMTPRRIQQIMKSYDLPTPQELRREAVITALKTNSVEDVREQFNLKSLREKVYLTEDEFQRLQSQITSKRDKLIASILYETGITASQLASLKQSDIAKQGIKVTPDERLKEPKTIVPISRELYHLILSYAPASAASSYLLSTRQSAQMSVRRVEQILASYSEILGFTITAQMLSNASKARLCQSYSQHRTHDVSQQGIPRLYEGYYSNKENGGENEIT